MSAADRPPSPGSDPAPREGPDREPTRDHSGAITLPPLIFLAGFAIGAGLEALWPTRPLPAGVHLWLAAAIATLAGGLALWAAPQFLRHRTSIHVHRPTTALITTGAYAWSRNPLYVGLVLLYLAGAVASNSLWVLAMGWPAVAVLQAGVIVREERYLAHRFGEAYQAYCRRVRRWL